MKTADTKIDSSGITPERELIAEALGGNQAAFREIYVRHRDRIHNILFYALGNADQAEDALQTVFLKAFRSLHDFRQDARLGTWLCRIALNEATNARTRSRGHHVPIEALLGSSSERDFSGLPDDLYAHAQRGEILQRAVQELPEKQRTAIVLRYVEGMSYEEIAEVLRCSTGTVASRLNRALSELETRLRFLKGLV